MTTPSSTEPPADVVRVLGESAVYCSSCGGWHHRLYHEPIPLTEAEEIVIRNGLVIEPLDG